jgi:carbamoyltransferase
MNSVANGKVTRETPFKQVYVPVGAADNGTAFGAAFHVWHQVLGQPRRFRLEHAYWGCGVDAADCRRAVEKVSGVRHVESSIRCRVSGVDGEKDRGVEQRSGKVGEGERGRSKTEEVNAEVEVEAREMGREALLAFALEAICDGKVVGWFQDRMEFGARALGSRSLLADPRRTDMRDIINLKIKFREKFRPFAPSVLEEYVREWFEVDEPSPFMERVLPIRPEKRSQIPAVTHVDGSGRLQTVSRRTSPLYWEMIERFRQRTGVPMLLNTSLNENEPIVRTPDEALSCFLRTAMDVLVLGNLVVARNLLPSGNPIGETEKVVAR